MITCQVSLFPLGREDYEKVVLKALDRLKDFDVEMELTPLSTIIRGDDEEVWKAVRALYEEGLKEGGKVIFTVTMTDRGGR
ncbi:Ykof family thiamine-binding protein [Thermovorax subterraneus]|nr:Ykof family thiamine-binding protein [Thermovorax subterraneus]